MSGVLRKVEISSVHSRSTLGVSGSAGANNWGELVRGSRDSGISTYVRDNGDHQVITKVIWAR